MRTQTPLTSLYSVIHRFSRHLHSYRTPRTFFPGHLVIAPIFRWKPISIRQYFAFFSWPKFIVHFINYPAIFFHSIAFTLQCLVLCLDLLQSLSWTRHCQSVSCPPTVNNPSIRYGHTTATKTATLRAILAYWFTLLKQTDLYRYFRSVPLKKTRIAYTQSYGEQWCSSGITLRRPGVFTNVLRSPVSVLRSQTR